MFGVGSILEKGILEQHHSSHMRSRHGSTNSQDEPPPNFSELNFTLPYPTAYDEKTNEISVPMVSYDSF